MSPDVFALWKKKPKHPPESEPTAMSSRPTYHSNGGRTSTSSDPSGIADGFGRLSLGSSDGRRQDGRPHFVGGFTPHSTHGRPGVPQADGPLYVGAVPPPPILHGGAHSTPSFQTSFPEPNRYPAPGPLPVPPPPPVPMPIPQTSRTMQYAMADNAIPSPPPKDHLRPPPLTRPYSDSNAFPSPGHLQPPATPQRPHLQQAPNSAPAKPPSSAPASRPSPIQTPSKRPRAASSPPSPTASTSSSSTKGELKVQCSGTTKQDKRCTRMVMVTAPLSRLNGEDLPHYCHQHIDTAFDDVKFPSHKDSGVWVEFKDWIPEYLQKETQDQLRKEMRTKHSVADVPGYIYAFEIDDTTRSDVVHIKVGRAVKLTKRLAEWDKQCQSKQTHLRGFWPSTKDADDGNLGRGRVQVGDPASWCHKLERLIHLELADLAVNAPYLEPGYPNVKGGTGSANARVVSRTSCPDCGKVHQEIFSFRRAKGRYKGKEWEEIVKPVIEKWGGFVEAYV